MTTKLLLKGLFLTFFSLFIVSCDNEPLEGEFITDDPTDSGSFIATVGNTTFTATSVVTSLNNGVLSMTAIDAEGDVLSIAVSNAGPCTYDLSSAQNPTSYIPSNDQLNGYSAGVTGGSGELTISAFDLEAMMVTGTFNFIGVREGAGGTMETVEITDGTFNGLTYQLINGANEISDCSDTGGGNNGGGNGGGSDPTDTFSVEIDAATFIVDTLTVERVVLSDIPLIRIVAKDADGAKVRLDIPEQLGVGTHEMVSISNGTQLIGLYNSNTGGENLTSNPGIITITEFNTVRGTLTASFNFTGTDPFNQDPTTVEVSAGEFSVSYEPDPMNPNTPFTAEINEVFFNPGFNVTAEETMVAGNSAILITATSGNERIEIVFPQVLTPGTYGMSDMIDDGDEVVGFYTPDVGAPTYTSNPGQLTLTTFDLNTGVLEGTFFFTATDPDEVDPEVYEVAEGRFTLVIQ